MIGCPVPCHFCNQAVSFTHFVDFFTCDKCASQRRVPVKIPSWQSKYKGLPEMRGLSQQELMSNYSGEAWEGTSGDLKIRIEWDARNFCYACCALQMPSHEILEHCTFPYPHLVIKWLAVWMQFAEA